MAVTARQRALGLIAVGGLLLTAGVALVAVPAALAVAGVALAGLGLLGLREIPR